MVRTSLASAFIYSVVSLHGVRPPYEADALHHGGEQSVVITPTHFAKVARVNRTPWSSSSATSSVRGPSLLPSSTSVESTNGESSFIRTNGAARRLRLHSEPASLLHLNRSYGPSPEETDKVKLIIVVSILLVGILIVSLLCCCYSGFLSWHFGTDLQCCFFLMALQCLQSLAITNYDFVMQFDADLQGPSFKLADKTIDCDLFATACAGFVSLIAWLWLWHCTYPHRMLKSSFYQDGRSIKANSFCETHFGTPMLVASQLNVMSSLVLAAIGLVQVVYFDKHLIDHGNPGHGICNICSGVLGAATNIFLNRSTYPELVARPNSDLGSWLQTESAQSLLGRQRAQWLYVHVASDTLFLAWFFVVQGISDVAAACFEVQNVFGIGYLISPLIELVGSLFFLRFGFSEGTMLDPLLFGCYKEASTQKSDHPMGDHFNAQASYLKTDRSKGKHVNVGKAVDAAVAVLDMEKWYDEEGSQTWWFEQGDHFGMKCHLEVGMNAFALACALKSEERKTSDPTVQDVQLIESVTDNTDVYFVKKYADPPMPRADSVFASTLQEMDGGIVVVEWAVQHADYPLDETCIREFPFLVFMLTPTSCRSTTVTVGVLTNMASWMPQVLVREQLENAKAELEELTQFPSSPDGQQVIEAVHTEIWKAVAAEASPCLWDFFVSVIPEVSALKIFPKEPPLLAPVAAPPDPNAALRSVPLDDAEMPFAIALGFAQMSDSWEEDKKKGAPSDPEVRLWTHKTQKGAIRAQVLIPKVHAAALGTMFQSEEFRRETEPNITELRQIKSTGRSTMWYQRSKMGWHSQDRDLVFACSSCDLNAERTLVVEWSTEDESCPDIKGVVRTPHFLLWDLSHVSKGVNGGSSVLVTVTALLDVGGTWGKYLRPVVDRESRKQVREGLLEMRAFFVSSDGEKLMKEVEEAMLSELIKEMQGSLTSFQKSFMEAHSKLMETQGSSGAGAASSS